MPEGNGSFFVSHYIATLQVLYIEVGYKRGVAKCMFMHRES